MAKKDTATLDSQAQALGREAAPALSRSETGPRGQTVAASVWEPSTVNTAGTPKSETKAGGNTSGFYIYVGPTLRGLIQTGTIYRGDRAHALEEAKKAIEQQPLVKTLIVSGDSLPQARLKVKTPGNALYANYRKILEK